MTLPTLQIFDTMRGTKVPLRPLRPGHVGIYACGVTVYDLSHIGHARVFVTFDIVVRHLRHRGYGVTYVRNHTDVDDKIIRRAAEEGSDPGALAQRYIEALDADMGALGVLPPDFAPRVTESIPGIVALIARLIERGHAYTVDGDVYFEVESFSDYGKLSHRKLDEMRAGERVAIDARKRNPFDFALWKSARPGEPSWTSPWGPGRPGWHIECSAMSLAHLGENFDIHGGGKDLVFPHHENEIAQSEGAHGPGFAHIWMHVGLVNIDGEKMSKSLGNFWTVRDVLALYDLDTIRAFMLSAHYRKPIAYTQAQLDHARHRIQYLYRAALALRTLWASVARPEPEEALLRRLTGEFDAAMDDDFNTPVGLAVVNEAGRLANELLATKKLSKQPDALARLAAIDRFLETVRDVFGILSRDAETALLDIRTRQAAQLSIDPNWVEERIAARAAARAAKSWEEADEIRAELAARFVELMDGTNGTTWRIEVPVEPEVATDSDSPSPSGPSPAPAG